MSVWFPCVPTAAPSDFRVLSAFYTDRPGLKARPGSHASEAWLAHARDSTRACALVTADAVMASYAQPLKQSERHVYTGGVRSYGGSRCTVLSTSR